MSEQDWTRLEKAFNKIKEALPWPSACIAVKIEELRKADNKGIDFVIRRLYNSSEFKKHIRLYGGPPGKYPRYPLRVKHPGPFGTMEYHYSLVRVKTRDKQNKEDHIMKCKWCGSKDGFWSDIYTWICRKCGKPTVD